MATRQKTKKEDSCAILSALGKPRLALSRTDILKGLEELAEPSEKASFALLSLQSKRRDIEEDTTYRRKVIKSKAVMKEEAAAKGLVQLCAELQERGNSKTVKAKVEVGRAANGNKRTIKAKAKQRERKKSISQQRGTNSDLEEAKNPKENLPPLQQFVEQFGKTSNGNKLLTRKRANSQSSAKAAPVPLPKGTYVRSQFAPVLNGNAQEKPKISKEYILSLMRRQSNGANKTPGEKKPLLKKCATHVGIAYYVEFNKKRTEKPDANAPASKPVVPLLEQRERFGILSMSPTFFQNPQILSEDPRFMLELIKIMNGGATL